MVRDATTGKVTMGDKSKIIYNTLSSEDKALYDIIEDKNKTVNISTTQDVTRSAGNGQLSPFFMGSFNNANNSSSYNEVNMIQAVGMENGGGQTAGATVRHEIFEGSVAIDLINNPSSTNSNSSNRQSFVPPAVNQNIYNQAHIKAASMDSNYKLLNTQGNQIYMNTTAQPMELWFNLSPNANSNKATGWFKIQ